MTWKPNLSGFSEALITATVFGLKRDFRFSREQSVHGFVLHGVVLGLSSSLSDQNQDFNLSKDFRTIQSMAGEPGGAWYRVVSKGEGGQGWERGLSMLTIT